MSFTLPASLDLGRVYKVQNMVVLSIAPLIVSLIINFLFYNICVLLVLFELYIPLNRLTIILLQ